MIVSAAMTAMHDVVGIAGYWFLRQSGLTDEEARGHDPRKKGEKYLKTTCGRKRERGPPEDEDPDDKAHREAAWRNIPVQRPPSLSPLY